MVWIIRGAYQTRRKSRLCRTFEFSDTTGLECLARDRKCDKQGHLGTERDKIRVQKGHSWN